MSDPSDPTKTSPEDGDASAAPPMPETEDFTPSSDPSIAEESAPAMSTSEPLSAMDDATMAPSTPMAESAAPVSAAPEPPPPPPAPEATIPTMAPPPTPMPPAGSAPSTYAPPTMTTPPPYTPPPPMSAPPSGKTKVVAGLLAILLGTLGAHQFYLGRTGWGIGFLALSLATCGFGTFITWPVAIIQGVMYLIATDEDFERKYVQEQRFF